MKTVQFFAQLTRFLGDISQGPIDFCYLRQFFHLVYVRREYTNSRRSPVKRVGEHHLCQHEFVFIGGLRSPNPLTRSAKIPIRPARTPGWRNWQTLGT
jgi:hypothetical protein